jgi:hypothetical protein
MRLTRLSGILAAVTLAAVFAGPAAATPTEVGTFEIDEHETVLQPESDACGFPIAWDVVGQGRYQVFFDGTGEATRLHVVGVDQGTLSARGTEITVQLARVDLYDFTKNIEAQVGLVFHYRRPGTGVVLSDRGRLVWNIDPDTGVTIGEPSFEAGPHPLLHDDFGDLCAAFDR